MTGRIEYELQHYDRDDGTVGTRAYFPAKRMTVDLGDVAEGDLAAAIEGAHSLPGPREVREWDIEQQAKRAVDEGETELEDTVAGWFRDGKLR